MSEKPEWFEMASEDPKPSEPKFNSKKRIAKIAIFTAPLLLVGGAMVFAEGDESDDAPKMDTTIPTATTNNTTAVVENVSTSNTTSTSKSTKSTSVTGVANPATSNTTGNSGTGVGVPKPSGRGGEHEGFEGREGHHGEGGEHEFGGEDD